MTTTLDIIDSAVKIGLGAIIGGFTSYMLATRTQKHAKETQVSRDAFELIKDLSLKLERVDSLISELAFNFHKGDLAVASQKSVDATSEICTASALANILGSDKLVHLIGEISDTLVDIYHELNCDEPQEDNLFQLSKKLLDLKKKAYPHIRTVYNERVT